MPNNAPAGTVDLEPSYVFSRRGLRSRSPRRDRCSLSATQIQHALFVIDLTIDLDDQPG